MKQTPELNDQQREALRRDRAQRAADKLVADRIAQGWTCESVHIAMTGSAYIQFCRPLETRTVQYRTDVRASGQPPLPKGAIVTGWAANLPGSSVIYYEMVETAARPWLTRISDHSGPDWRQTDEDIPMYTLED